MCTIVVVYRVHPTYPVIVAANRDEFFGRATLGPRVLREDPVVVGGVDEQKGGTWMGATGAGAFVGLTNQRSYAGSDASLLSRGEVVLGALAAGKPGAVREYLSGLDARRYNPFNLIYGDATGIELATARSHDAHIAIQSLEPGIIVVSNDGLDTREFPKVERARELVRPIARQPWPTLAANLVSCLADHDLPHHQRVPEPPVDSVFARQQLAELQRLCVHMGAYGTRSATIMAMAPGRVAHYLYVPGPPCQTPVEDVSDLFAAGNS